MLSLLVCSLISFFLFLQWRPRQMWPFTVITCRTSLSGTMVKSHLGWNSKWLLAQHLAWAAGMNIFTLLVYITCWMYYFPLFRAFFPSKISTVNSINKAQQFIFLDLQRIQKSTQTCDCFAFLNLQIYSLNWTSLIDIGCRSLTKLYYLSLNFFQMQ